MNIYSEWESRIKKATAYLDEMNKLLQEIKKRDLFCKDPKNWTDNDWDIVQRFVLKLRFALKTLHDIDRDLERW